MHKTEENSWLNQSQRYLEDMYLHAGIGITRVMPNGRFMQANPKFCETVGYSSEELSQLTFLDITHPDDIAISKKWVVELLEGQSDKVVGEKRYLHKQGHFNWMRITIVPVRDQQGRVQYFVTAAEDITDQKASEELLRHQRETLELMAQNRPLKETLSRIVKLIEDQAPGSMSTIYLVEDGKLRTGAAPSFPEEFILAVDGCPIGPVAGSCGAAAFYGHRVFSTNVEKDSCWGDYRDWALSYGLRAAWSTPVLSKDGKVIGTVSMCWKEPKEPTQRHFELTAVATRLMGIAIEREQTEKLLREQQLKMITSSKLAALGEMASGLAHEINNPLAIISVRAGQINIAAEKNKLTKELALDITGSIRQTTERISKIIRGLRSFARDGEQDPIQEAHLETIFEETLVFCRERFKSHRIELRVQDMAGIKLRCRAVQISQVLLNLLNNSFDAVENSPEKWVEINIEDQLDSVLISIKDSGPGIPEKLRDKILQPFFTTKPVNKGTGLGLSISNSIILSHRGTLSLDLKSPHTCFRIHLPKNLEP